jgi:hypothetical protein
VRLPPFSVAAAADVNAGSFFSYFTHLSYVGLCAYFWASGVQTAAFALRARSGNYNPTYPLQRWHRILQFLHVLLFSTIITYRVYLLPALALQITDETFAAIIVTAVFWSILSSPATLGTRWNRKSPALSRTNAY